jgi:hypothetical protein
MMLIWKSKQSRGVIVDMGCGRTGKLWGPSGDSVALDGM